VFGPDEAAGAGEGLRRGRTASSTRVVRPGKIEAEAQELAERFAKVRATGTELTDRVGALATNAASGGAIAAEARELAEHATRFVAEARELAEHATRFVKKLAQKDEQAAKLRAAEARAARLEAELAKRDAEDAASAKRVKRDHASDFVKLDVCGHHFTTSTTTLRAVQGSMLSTMVSGFIQILHTTTTRWTVRLDEHGRLRIDRDGRHFHLILNFLRDGVCEMPVDGNAKRELLREANFYGLHGLRDLIQPRYGSVLASGADFEDGVTPRAFHQRCDGQEGRRRLHGLRPRRVGGLQGGDRGLNCAHECMM